MNNLFVLGFNHHQLNLAERSQIALDEGQTCRLYRACLAGQAQAVCVLNTCNRTEIYGQGNPAGVFDVLAGHLHLGVELKQKALRLQGEPAAAHLFKVAAGLDSQIIGDLEILGQFKKAFQTAKQHGALNGYLERLANTAVEAAKAVRHQTELFRGAASLSYATVQLVAEQQPAPAGKLLVLGLGQLGTSIARNLRHYLPAQALWVANRSLAKSQALAQELQCEYLDINDLPSRAAEFSVIVASVANLAQPLLRAAHLPPGLPRLLVDLSVPAALEADLGQSPGHVFYSLDAVATRLNQSLDRRRSAIPQAEQILHQYVHEFMAWSQLHTHSGHIRQWKDLVQTAVHQCPHLQAIAPGERDSLIKKSVAKFARFVKHNPEALARQPRLMQHWLEQLLSPHPVANCQQPCPEPTADCHFCPHA
jgi:glutamyl-tRNA reductase